MKNISWLMTLLLVGASLVGALFGHTRASMQVTNADDNMVKIFLFGSTEAHLLPAALTAAQQDLPHGSFVVRNQSSRAGNVLVAKWVFIGSDQRQYSHILRCDGLMFYPPQVVLKPNSFTLVTPAGCASEEQFGSLSSSGVLDGHLPPGQNQATRATDLANIKATVDEVIFGDGGIWGPDETHYYQTILDRHAAAVALAEELTSAQARGESIKARANIIRNETPTRNSKVAGFRRDLAALVARSPKPEALLKQLGNESSLPPFYHIRER